MRLAAPSGTAIPRCVEPDPRRCVRGLVRRLSARDDVRVEWIAVVLVVVALVGTMVGLTFLARRIRRRGAAGQAIAGAMAAFDEGFRSTGHDTFVEMQAQDERGGSARSEDL
jgi:hypothetical protein